VRADNVCIRADVDGVRSDDDSGRADDDSGRADDDSGRADDDSEGGDDDSEGGDDDSGRADVVGGAGGFVHAKEIEVGTGGDGASSREIGKMNVVMIGSDMSDWCRGRASRSSAPRSPAWMSNERKIARLKESEIPIYEPSLKDLMMSTNPST